MGRTKSNPPSQFLFDIPAELLSPDSNRPEQAVNRYSDPWGSTGVGAFGMSSTLRSAERAPQITELSYSPGDMVYHKHFGVGVVVASESSGGDEEVTVQFTAKTGPVLKRLSVILSGLEHA